MRVRLPLAIGLAAVSPAAILSAQAATPRSIAIRHVPVTCMVAGAHPRIDACLDPAEDVSRARVLFRADGGPTWYFVDMVRGGTCLAATLPQPLARTRRVRYVIEAVSRSSVESRSEEFAPRVERNMAACGGVAAPATSHASVTVGSLVPDAPAMPPGFGAAGVAPGGVAIARSGGGGAKKALLIGGGAVVAAGAVLAAVSTKGIVPGSEDEDGDGFTPLQGDCNDADAAVRPGGDVQFTVDFGFSGTTACSTRNPQQQVYRLTNRSCETVSLQTLQVMLTLGGTCSGGESYPVSLEATQVAPGASAIVRRGAPAGSVAPLCCRSYPCAQGNCTISLQYVLGTSAGTRTVVQSYAIADVTGRDCPLCGSIGTDETFRPAASGGDGLTGTAPIPPY